MDKKILEILQQTRPESDFKSSDNFIADGLLDSFDMVLLVDELQETFGVLIDGTQIVPENFASVDAIAHLIEESK